MRPLIDVEDMCVWCSARGSIFLWKNNNTAVDAKLTEGFFPDLPQKQNARATDPSVERPVGHVVMNHGAPWFDFDSL